MVAMSLPCLSNFNTISSHLVNAIQSTKTQYSVDLAELEVAITAGVDKETKWTTIQDLLIRIDEIEAPLYQVNEVGSDSLFQMIRFHLKFSNGITNLRSDDCLLS